MKLVMTLLARDEADVIESWLAFHLNAGADFVVATDNRSQDGTTDVLERYAREGLVHLIREPGDDLRQDEWVTRMARLAATDFGADWVINSDADEFWWPRGASLAHVLAAIPARYGTVGAFLRTFAPRPDGDGPFAERHHRALLGARADQRSRSLYKPIRKVIHRGASRRSRSRADNHARRRQPVRSAARLVPGRGAPLPAPLARAVRAQGAAPGERVESTSTGRRPRTTRRCSRRSKPARSADYYAAQVVADDEVERGRRRRAARRRHAAARRAAADLRRPTAARSTFPTPTLVDEATYAVEAAVLGEADVVRLQRRLDTLEARLASVEQRLPNRVYRKLARRRRSASLRRQVAALDGPDARSTTS